ncbi:hypothetical protein MUP01_02205, partial [Candidatus Bathyarchaeota archaeon]|nr:hypothetical protein [Candidatus Bathyarchaeota archaeon]
MPLAPADISTFTLEEYEGLLTNVLSAKVVNKDEPVFMNQIRSPLVQAMIKRAPKDMGDPVDGGYKVVLQGDYNQR